MESLNQRFARSNGAPIDVDGHEVHGLVRVPVRGGDRVRVRFVSARSRWPQGVQLLTRKGELLEGGIQGRAALLWNIQGKGERTVDVIARGGPIELQIWNVWQYEDGQTQAWVNNAGLVVEKRADAMVLRCSDGYGEPDFSNLVVEVTITPPESST
jgi:hypothetical protein